MNRLWKTILLSTFAMYGCVWGGPAIQQAVEIVIPTDSNTTYQVQTSSNLVDWVDSGTPFNGYGETEHRFFSTTGKHKEYYQVKETVPSNLVEIEVMSYLNPFGAWVYDAYDEGTEPAADLTVRSLGTASRNGQTIIIKQEYDAYGESNDQQFISTDFSGRCEETGWYNHGEGDWYWNRPLPLILPRFIPGQTNFFSGYTRTDMEGVFDLALVMTNEQVTVPAGTFDTVRVTSVFNILPPSPFAGTYVFHAWYAEHAGLVKRVQEDGTRWELKASSSYVDNLLPSLDDIDSGTWVNAVSQPENGSVWMYGTPESVIWNRSLLQGTSVSIYVLHDDPTDLSVSDPDPIAVEGKNWFRFASGVTNSGTYTADPSRLQGNGNAYKILVVSDENYWSMSQGQFTLQP